MYANLISIPFPIYLQHRLRTVSSGCCVLIKKRSIFIFLYKIFQFSSDTRKTEMNWVKTVWKRLKRTRAAENYAFGLLLNEAKKLKAVVLNSQPYLPEGQISKIWAKSEYFGQV